MGDLEIRKHCEYVVGNKCMCWDVCVAVCVWQWWCGLCLGSESPFVHRAVNEPSGPSGSDGIRYNLAMSEIRDFVALSSLIVGSGCCQGPVSVFFRSRVVKPNLLSRLSRSLGPAHGVCLWFLVLNVAVGWSRRVTQPLLTPLHQLVSC